MTFVDSNDKVVSMDCARLVLKQDEALRGVCSKDKLIAVCRLAFFTGSNKKQDNEIHCISICLLQVTNMFYLQCYQKS